MADLSALTAAQVLQSSAAVIKSGTAGEAITQGQPVYIDTANSNVIKKCTNAAILSATCAGIAITTCAASGQKVYYASEDTSFTLSTDAGVVVGDSLYIGSTAGLLTKTQADLTTGKCASFIGTVIANNPDKILLKITNGTALVA
jgi:hypothetical protein